MTAPLTDDKDWEYKLVPNLMGGIDGYKRPDTLEDNQAIKLINIIAKQGVVVADTGYKEFAPEPVYSLWIGNQPALFGTPQLETQFLRTDGSLETILVTTKTVYKYDAGNKRYHLVKGTFATTIDSVVFQANVGSITVIKVVDGSGFTTGDVVSFATDSGDEYICTVAVAGNSLFLLNHPLFMPAANGINFATGGIVKRGVRLNGTVDHQVSFAPYPGNDWLVFTNGVDIVKRYDGTDCIDVPNLPSAGNTICKAVAVYNAALFLLNTTEGGVRHPQRARRSNQGDPTDWTTGTAGKDDLLDLSAEILNAAKLGDYLIVYRDGAISRGQFIGASGINYFFEDMIPNEGPNSVLGVAVTEDYHVVSGKNNVYKYTGNYSLPPIGDPIFHAVFSNKGNLNPQQKHKIALAYIPETEEIWFAYASVNSDSPDTIYRYNITYGIWYVRQMVNQVLSFNLYQHQNIFTWDDLVGTWADQAWTWDTQVQMQEAQVVHMCSAVSAKVFEYDYNTKLDNGTAISYYVESKDFLAPDIECRFDTLEMYISGTNVVVEYSTDEGRSWSYFGEDKEDATVNEEHKTKVRMCKQFPFQRVRFRWAGQGPDFALEWFSLLFKKDSLW